MKEQSETTWEPILAEPLRSSAQESIAAIAAHLASEDPQAKGPFALCEQALLFAYLALSGESDRSDERAIEYINLAAEKVSAIPRRQLDIGLYNGLAGIGFLIEHVAMLLSEVSIETDTSTIDQDDEQPIDPIAEIDQVILACLEQSSWTGRYDLISGLVGVGTYWIERLPRREAIHGLDLILRQLEDQAKHLPPGITWFTPPGLLPTHQLELCPSGYYNLGVAHGVPGVAKFLSDLVAIGIERPRAQYLLEGSIRWILAQQRPPHAVFRFSSWVVPGYESSDSRLGWCYGDLGIAAILSQCAVSAARKEWHRASEALFDHCVLISKEAGAIRDAGLCHGAFGVAHILNRVYQSGGQRRFGDAANSWFRVGLAMRKTTGGIGGFFTYSPDKPSVWIPDSSFLAGAVGIALALLSAAHQVEPRWDRLLLLSRRNDAWKLDRKLP